jgi:glycosyltransferase involved in cell wall biosynthesis
MRSSDCFILFSNYENLPVVLVEAFASGLPVISSNVGGIAEHLSAQRGKLVPARDNRAFIIAMEEMITELSEKKYDRQAIASYARSHFSYEKISTEYHELYHQITSKHV